jgi:hypothetical protein
MPLYGNALNLIRSGVLAPLLVARPFFGGANESPLLFGEDMVVIRTASVVSSEGGGGRFICRSEKPESMCARQRKHSPLP